MADIALVEPRAPRLNVFSYAALPRLGLPSMAAVLRNLGHRVRIYCQGLASLPMGEILAADVVGISTTTSTAPEAYRIADLCRSRGRKVIIGGVHATFRPDEAREHADGVVLGEGEGVIGEVVERVLDREEEVAPSGEGICRVADMDSLPIPDLGAIRGWRVGALYPIMTSRGCPFGCSFCTVSSMFGRRYRFRSAGLVLEEIARARAERLFFYDDNFAANRQRTVELLEGMMRLRSGPRQWMAQVRADVAEDLELVDLFKASGCYRLFIGYESVSQATLSEYGKGLSVEQIAESIRVLRERRISVHGMFVLGSDQDDVATIRRTAAFALRNALDTVQFMILTPLPGTRQFQVLEAAKRIFVRDWSKYDGHHVVYEPLQMTAAALQREMWRAYRRFYSVWRGIRAVARGRLGDGEVNAYARLVIGLSKMQGIKHLRMLAARAKRKDRAVVGEK